MYAKYRATHALVGLIDIRDCFWVLDIIRYLSNKILPASSAYSYTRTVTRRLSSTETYNFENVGFNIKYK